MSLGTALDGDWQSRCLHHIFRNKIKGFAIKLTPIYFTGLFLCLRHILGRSPPQNMP